MTLIVLLLLTTDSSRSIVGSNNIRNSKLITSDFCIDRRNLLSKRYKCI